MARNGSGTYTNPYPNFVSGTVISSSETDANNSDIATALTQSIAVDGQAVVTANIPLATHKLTGVSAGSAVTDSLNLGQAQAEAFIWCGTAGGSADAITLSPSPAITAYAAGQRFVWMASSSVNTGATTVAISGLGTIALQDNGAALVAGNHAANKMFMGILNTTSTVQIMQVQISGTDPLIVSSLTVSGTSLLTGVTTHGDDVVSDTDSTDDLGTTSVRWANLFVDGITATDQITATGFTGTLDGILGSGAAAAATVTTIDASGVATATTFEPDGDTSASDNAAIGYTSVEGLILTGQGSTNDVTIKNDADAEVMGVLTGTTTAAFTGEVTGTGFTGTLDGILGGGTPAAATVTTIDASGVATATTFEPDGDTSAADNAAIGYTSVEGLILTGQGSSGDVTIKNDADGKVMEVLTGTTTAAFSGEVTGTGFTGTLDGVLGGGTPAAATVTTIDASGVATATTFEPDGDTSAADNAAIGYTSDEGLILTGQGAVTDVTIKNDADATVFSIATGTTTGTFAGTVLAKTDTDTSNTGGVTLDFTANQNFVLTFTGNVTLDNPTTEQVGQSGIIVCIQDGTGSRTLSLGSQFKTAGDAGITLSTAANSVDIIPYFVSAAGSIIIGAVQLAMAGA